MQPPKASNHWRAITSLGLKRRRRYLIAALRYSVRRFVLKEVRFGFRSTQEEKPTPQMNFSALKSLITNHRADTHALDFGFDQPLGAGVPGRGANWEPLSPHRSCACRCYPATVAVGLLEYKS
jgi:hypothetical protein